MYNEECIHEKYTIDKKIYFANRTCLNRKYFVLVSLIECLILVTNSPNEKYMSKIAFFWGALYTWGDIISDMDSVRGGLYSLADTVQGDTIL